MRSRLSIRTEDGHLPGFRDAIRADQPANAFDHNRAPERYCSQKQQDQEPVLRRIDKAGEVVVIDQSVREEDGHGIFSEYFHQAQPDADQVDQDKQEGEEGQADQAVCPGIVTPFDPDRREEYKEDQRAGQEEPFCPGALTSGTDLSGSAALCGPDAQRQAEQVEGKRSGDVDPEVGDQRSNGDHADSELFVQFHCDGHQEDQEDRKGHVPPGAVVSRCSEEIGKTHCVKRHQKDPFCVSFCKIGRKTVRGEEG